MSALDTEANIPHNNIIWKTKSCLMFYSFFKIKNRQETQYIVALHL